MNETAREASRVVAFARSVRSDVPAVDEALAELRALLAREGVPYAIVGGVAVVQHGYVRTSLALDVLLDREGLERLRPALAAVGFERVGARKWRHGPTGAGVDLLVAGEPIPPAGRGVFPEPAQLERSDVEPDVAALAPLVELKLAAHRHQDVADVVGLLQLLDEGRYLGLEAALPASLRPEVARLRTEALEERRGQE